MNWTDNDWGTEAWGTDAWGGQPGFSLIGAWPSSASTITVRYSLRPGVEATLPGSYVLSGGLIGPGPGQPLPTVIGVRPSAEQASSPSSAGYTDLDLVLSTPLGGASFIYAIAVASYLRSASGLTIQTWTASFRGLTTRATSPDLQAQDIDPSLVDLDYRYTAIDGLLGAGYNIQDGDYATASGEATVRKRIIRRCTTAPGTWVWAPSYGLMPRQSSALTASKLAEYQQEVERQMAEEPGLSNATAAISYLPGRGTVFVTINGQLTSGGNITVGPIPVSQD